MSISKRNGTTEFAEIGATDTASLPRVRTVRPGVRATMVAAARLAANRRRLHHRPTRGQVRTMARWDGREPCSYLLDPAVNFIPDPLEFGYERELGRHALCFTGRTPTGQASELVVFADGGAFDLLGGPW